MPKLSSTLFYTKPSRALSSSSSSPRSSLPKLPPLQTLLKRGFTPTLNSIIQFLLFLSHTHRFNTVIHFFSQMESNQIKGNSQTRSILTWALLKLHKYEDAEHFMRTQMAKASNFPRNRMWDTLIQGLCINQKDPDKALLVLRDCLRKYGTFPSSFTFCSLIYRFSSMGDMSKAIEVVELMTDEKINYPFNNFVCSSVISGFCKIGKPEIAAEFFENALKSGALQPNVVVYTALVGALCKLGRVSEVCDLVCKMAKEGLAFDVVFYSSWICGYISEGSLMEVFRKKRQMVDKGIRPDTVSYTILVDGFSKLGDVEKAIGFLKKMRKGGLEPSLITYTTIMLGFCEKGKLEEAFAIYKMVKDLEIEVDEFMYATLIHGFCMRGDLDGVFRLLDEMEKKGINPSIVTYNTVINGLCKFGRTAEAEKISKGISGDTITYSTLLHGYIEEENTSGILETKRRLEEAGVFMDVVMCNILIKALFMVGAFEDAYILYKGMPEKGLTANSITYCTMIDGYCKVGRIDEALEIFDEFRRTPLSSVACYNCIINWLCKQGMVDMATEVFIELNQKSLTLDDGICKMLLKATFKQKSATGVLNLVHRVENLRPGMYDVMSNVAISFLCKRGFHESAFEVYAVMRREGSVATRKTYYSILDGLINDGKEWLTLPLLNIFLKEYGLVEPKVSQILAYHMCLKDVNDAFCFLEKIKDRPTAITLPISLFKTLMKKGKVLVAYQLFMEAEDSVPVLDAFDYSHMVDGLCKGGYISEALDLCGFAKSKGITLNIIAYNSVINGLCRQGHLVDAFRLFDSLERINLVPSEITYATLIDSLRREGFLLDAKQLFESMVLKGFKPNTHVYNSIIDGFCKIGHMEDALKLLCELDMKSLRPDEFTVTIVINGFCQKGDMEGALNFFTEFKRNGTSPDFLGFLNLIRGLCAKGRMEEARSILREMLQSQSVLELINRVDVELETESLESLLVSLCEQGSIQEAVTVLNEIASMFFPVRSSSIDRHQSHKLQKPCDSEDPKTVASKSVTSINADSGIQFSGRKKVEKVAKTCDVIGSRSQFHDFDYYYKQIASLCSIGELQKASELVKEIVSNLGKS
ncbi:putative tetratricopeptide-like helical domain-containing protein [Rosa chinensis]|uniref:Putative tetratricopeptide-like helical domain-containing protein n=1 Tax=Rosa chinensis TaxID=74649 RepID=A0A2P6QSP1_ROSCH|nr:pentatricopeptide repeat-containing protein At5g57250, mitochondrial [Rosa chinensis]XP_024195234.1 pentatricopeptide repeat-containing protein At5g57250, mitochondrial [Rosa chinensis]XP_024195237.1 pentatricopeptide repeat-containing protein At5g57250, mitochondrial [Rosa chinensis]XP_040374238.1 pentatricopeptide repeat-containing protein At5g57250, mitochondrial [Rosa chinensis]XP_040374239.1 pentatricopeptide repeat-containing protein At5g57250, mitochondrial [Rosa chinensis]XP_0403742